MKQDSTQWTSDARYIFILFGLVFVVLFFAFLIYFIYGQKQFANRADTQSDIPTVNLDDTDAPVKNVETVQPTTKDITPATTNQPNPTTVIPPVVTPTSSAILARYNPRSADTLKLQGKTLLDAYFSAIQKGDYTLACSLLSSGICSARRDVFTFSQFLNKTNGGYQIKSISLAKEQKPTEAIYCVEYSYTLKADLNPQPVTEYFQYRIKTRPDGADEISARVCEKVVKDGRERPCPIITPKKYCF